MWKKTVTRQKQPREVFFVKKVFLEISQNSQENTCTRVSFLIKLQAWGQSLFFNKVAGLRPATLLKKRLWHRCFPVNFVKISKNTFLTEHLRTTASASLQKPKPFFTNREKSVIQETRRVSMELDTWYLKITTVVFVSECSLLE